MLRYTQFDEPVERHLVEGPLATAGRRLKAGGVLSGALHTLGYYSTDVCLGSPPRCFDLIVDTGSSITAVPCSTCQKCGQHRCGSSGRFNTQGSSSASLVSCKKPPAGFNCEACGSSSACTYSVHYTEGSAIKGHVVTDVAHFSQAGLPQGPARELSTRVYFGCQTLETGMFYKQVADGIMGMQPPRARARVPSMLFSLVRQEKAADAFSLCLSDTAGLLLLGGTPQPERIQRRGGLVVPMQRNARARYTLKLADVRASGAGRQNTSFASLRLGRDALAPTLVDSGTTFVYASTPLYRALHAHIKAHAPPLERVGNKVCAHLTPGQLGELPSLQLVFDAVPGSPLIVRPFQYMVHFPAPRGTSFKALARPAGSRHYCVAIFDNQRGGTVIGASILRQREVVFDVARSEISFIDADCNTITPASSHLERAYSFSRPGPNASAVRPMEAAAPVLRPLAGAGRGATAKGGRRRAISKRGGGVGVAVAVD